MKKYINDLGFMVLGMVLSLGLINNVFDNPLIGILTGAGLTLLMVLKPSTVESKQSIHQASVYQKPDFSQIQVRTGQEIAGAMLNHKSKILHFPNPPIFLVGDQPHSDMTGVDLSELLGSSNETKIIKVDFKNKTPDSTNLNQEKGDGVVLEIKNFTKRRKNSGSDDDTKGAS